MIGRVVFGSLCNDFSRRDWLNYQCPVRLSSQIIKCWYFKETRSVTMKIFRKKYFLFKSFVKVELCYVFTINMFSTSENCKEKRIILLQ